MLAMREEFPVEEGIVRLEPRVARIEGEVVQINSRLGAVEVDLRDLRKSIDQKLDKLGTKIDRIDAKFESKLEALSTRRFTLWVTVISSVATIAAAVLAIVFSSPHGH